MCGSTSWPQYPPVRRSLLVGQIVARENATDEDAADDGAADDVAADDVVMDDDAEEEASAEPQPAVQLVDAMITGSRPASAGK